MNAYYAILTDEIQDYIFYVLAPELDTATDILSGWLEFRPWLEIKFELELVKTITTLGPNPLIGRAEAIEGEKE